MQVDEGSFLQHKRPQENILPPYVYKCKVVLDLVEGWAKLLTGWATVGSKMGLLRGKFEDLQEELSFMSIENEPKKSRHNVCVVAAPKHFALQ